MEKIKNILLSFLVRIRWWRLLLLTIICFCLSYYFCHYRYYTDESLSFQSYISSVDTVSPSDVTVNLSHEKLIFNDEINQWPSIVPPFIHLSYTNNVKQCYKNGVTSFSLNGKTITSDQLLKWNTSSKITELGRMEFTVVINDKNYFISILPGQTSCISVNAREFTKSHIGGLKLTRPYTQDAVAETELGDTSAFIWPGIYNEVTLFVLVFLYFGVIWSSLLGIKDLFWKRSK